MASGWGGQKTVTTASPPLYTNLYYVTSRSGNTVTYSLALKVWTDNKYGWRNNRWACQFTVNGTDKGKNRTIKPQTSGTIGTTPYWPTSDSSGSGSYSQSNDTKYLYSNHTTTVSDSATSFSVSVNIRDTGYGTGETGTYSWGTPYTNFGTFTWSIPIDTRTYTVSYNANGGSGAPSSQTKTYGSNLTLSSTKPTRTGYTFAGWATSSSGSVAYQPGGTYSNNASVTLYAKWDVNYYYLDVNGRLDGTDSGNISGYGTFDLMGQNDINDYYTQLAYGTTYSITDIKATTGHTYEGVQSGSLSGTITGATSVRLQFKTNTYTNYCQCWTWGYKNGEGNNGDKTAFHIGDTSWTATYGTNVSWTADKAKTAPNGFTMRNSIGSSSHSSSWTGYNLPYAFTQPAKNCYAEYDYDPISYSITYTMNGGTNNSSNPSSYNVLYGVTFANPTRSGYDFKGWTIGGTAVTGINVGQNASFSSADDLYNKCKNRTTGNKTVVANWLETKPSNVKINTINVTGPFTIDLAWSATGVNISNYTVYYRVQGTSTWSSKNCGTSTTTTLDVAEETTYEFFVRATNPGGTGDSSTSTATTPADQAKIRRKADGQWVKGKTYYKKDGQWVKAKKIYIKVDGQWKIGTNYDS